MFVLSGALPLLGPCALLAASAWRKLYCLPMVVSRPSKCITLSSFPSPDPFFPKIVSPPLFLALPFLQFSPSPLNFLLSSSLLMACNLAANSFDHPLFGSCAVKDNMLFGSCYVAKGKPIDCGDDADDALGELREEEIVWGEAEMHHQHKDLTNGGERLHSKVGSKINHSGDHRVIRHRSMLSREMEMQASTWAPGRKISTVLVEKQSAKGSGQYMKVAPDHKDCEVEVGGTEAEEEGVQQHMDELIPPHELLARQYAASTTSFSVLHGAGRTLKGMDLRRLRNEVWRQTGFID